MVSESGETGFCVIHSCVTPAASAATIASTSSGAAADPIEIPIYSRRGRVVPASLVSAVSRAGVPGVSLITPPDCLAKDFPLDKYNAHGLGVDFYLYGFLCVRMSYNVAY
jgi:hypothetical protein